MSIEEQNEKYNDFMHIIGQELSMYDHLSKHDKYKQDRLIAQHKHDVLIETLKEFKKIYKN
jgi:hypothetical protein